MTTPEISIVIPVYNSSKIISSLHMRIVEALKGMNSFEIILVNDGSMDDSWSTIQELAGQSKYITGVNLRKNSGQDNALLAGLRLAKGNYVVIMDDDLQHDPKDILPLYEACKVGFDVCYANFNVRKQTMIKNAGSNVNGKVAELLVKKPKGIYLSAYKIINRSTVNEIIKFSGPYPYIDGIILSITSSITQIAAEHCERLNGKSNYSFMRSFSLFMRLFTGFSVLPLRMATITGCIATFVGFCLSLKYLFDYFITKDYIAGWTTVVVLIIFFGGLILITLGIIGEYIGRMYLAINNKPQYSISEIVKSKED